MSLLQMSLSAGVMIVIVVIIRALFLNELPKATFPILWLAVLVRLVLPFSFEAAFSMNDFLLQRFEPNVSVYEIGSSSLTTNDDIFSQTNPSYQSEITQGEMLANELEQPQHMLTENQFESILISVDWWFVGWLSGLALFMSFFIFNYWKSHQKIRCAIPIKNEFLTAWKAEQSLKRSFQILESDQITTPVATGILKPKIILPAEMDLSDELNLQYVLTHELYHIKRWDALWKILTIGVACLHWFNPFVWVMCVLANRDLEISCDAQVVKKIGKNSKKMYAYVLIEMAEQKSGFTPFYSSFAKHAAEERIRAIMKTKKATWLGIGVAILLIGVLTVNAFAMSGVEIEEEIYVAEAEAEVNDSFDLEAIYEALIEISAGDYGGEWNGENESDYSQDSEARWNAIYASLVEVQTGNMTFQIGDFDLDGTIREQYFFSGKEGWLNWIRSSGEYLTAEEVAIIVANVVYGTFDFNVDGTIFDVFLRPEHLDGGAEDNRVLWDGFIYSPDAAVAGVESYFYFSVFADTGEIRVISYSREDRFYPEDWLD